MKITGHRLYDNDAIPYRPSKNYTKNLKLRPEYLVIHYTAGTSAEGSINWLTNQQSKASAHLVIARDGSITQLLSFDKVAWHAGKSQWKDKTGLNKYSIGIELDNAGQLKKTGDKWTHWAGHVIDSNEVMIAQHKNQQHQTGWHNFPPEQIESLIAVSSLLLTKYGCKEILGHDDIAPTRKTDPGPAFPMQSFQSLVMGRAFDEEDDAIEEDYSDHIPIRSLSRQQHNGMFSPYILKQTFKKFLIDHRIYKFSTDAIHVRDDNIEIRFNAFGNITDHSDSVLAHRDAIQLIPRDGRLSGGILRNISIHNATIKSDQAHLQAIFASDGRFEQITIKNANLSTKSVHGITFNGLLSGTITGNTCSENALITLNPTRLGGGVSNIWIASELDRPDVYQKIRGINDNSIDVIDNRNIFNDDSLEKDIFLNRYIHGKENGLVIKNFSFATFETILDIFGLDKNNPSDITTAVLLSVETQEESEIIYAS
ncbi:MAG: N-acetylmuramoyl-L-alanine amidase [Cocleimonas sp.]|nr:N-acetylmuramoyl-L-alanine amidase [Cocleimonas sp.]